MSDRCWRSHAHLLIYDVTRSALKLGNVGESFYWLKLLKHSGRRLQVWEPYLTGHLNESMPDGGVVGELCPDDQQRVQELGQDLMGLWDSNRYRRQDESR